MPHEIFVSYSRDNPGICDDVVDVLTERLGFTVFVDRRELAGGSRWDSELEQAINQAQCVLLLATQKAVDEPKFIRLELAAASSAGIPIIPLQFDKDASKALIGHGRFQYIKVDRGEDSCRDPDALEIRLRHALLHRTERVLKERHRETGDWISRNLPQPSFWAGRWKGIVPDSGHLAITAPAGRGKSVLAAHHAQRRLADDPGLYALLLDQETTDLKALAGDLNAPTPEDLQQRLQELEERYKRRVVFIVDGLDQAELGDDPRRSDVMELLRFMANAGQLLITCRDDVWDSTFAGHLTVDVAPVGELDSLQVTHQLPAAGDNLLLRTPLFLNLALQHSANWRTIPRTDIEFFQRLFQDIRDDSSAVPSSTGAGKLLLLSHLAEAQLARLSYEIPVTDLFRRSGLAPTEFRQVLDGLKREHLLVERSLSPWPSLRLAHDLLDCYNIADAVYQQDDHLAAMRELCTRSEGECGWSVLSALIRIAAAHADHSLLRCTFGEFLRILDHKRLSDTYMAQAWAVTYVLREQLPVLLPLVLEALEGEPTPSLKPGETGTGSRIGVSLTQEAASSVASSFLTLSHGDLQDAPEVVPVLEAGLRRWWLKGRFIDALSRYDTDRVRQIIVGFGQDLLLTRDDPACLRYVAQGLDRLEKHPSIENLLSQISLDTELDPVTRRRAHQALSNRYGRRQPPRDEEEIVFGLRIDDARAAYSDWDVIREYADHVKVMATSGRRSFGPQVCSALVQCLKHTMIYVGIPAAIALGCFDDPMARNALLDQLLKEVLPAEIRRASLDALRRQLDRTANADDQRTFRMLLLLTARIAEDRGSTAVARDLIELATSDASDLVTPGAIEATPAFTTPLRTIVSGGPEIDPAISVALAALEHIETGPDREIKYRFTSITQQPDHIEIHLAPTTWTISRRFHTALQQDPHWTSHQPDGAWIQPVPFGATLLPGTAVVHAIVLTADDKIIFAQRGDAVGYAPSHWSASFEEQINEKDFGHPEDPFVHATRRGFLEEFGCEIAAVNVTPLTSLMQIDLLNLGLVVVLRPKQTAAEIQASWQSRARDKWEAKQVKGLPLDTLETALRGITPLHSTSDLRCQALLRWLSIHA